MYLNVITISQINDKNSTSLDLYEFILHGGIHGKHKEYIHGNRKLHNSGYTLITSRI